MARKLGEREAENLRIGVSEALRKAEPPKSNLSFQQWCGLFIASKRGEYCHPTDKGKVIVIMDRGDYTYKMKQVPEDGKYKTLNWDPTVKINKKIAQTLKQLKDEGHIDHT